MMQARMKNPAMILPGAMQALQAATQKGGVPATTLGLVHLRASQINGCSACVDSGTRYTKKAGESGERHFAVAAGRGATHIPGPQPAPVGLPGAGTPRLRPADPGPG